MSDRFDTHRDIINVWPSLAAFAEDIGIVYETAKGMRSRGSIDGAYWQDVVRAAQVRIAAAQTQTVRDAFAAVTLEALAEAAAAKRRSRMEVAG